MRLIQRAQTNSNTDSTLMTRLLRLYSDSKVKTDSNVKTHKGVDAVKIQISKPLPESVKCA